MIGEYATAEELVAAKEAELIKKIPELDINFLSDRIQQMLNAPHLYDNGAFESEE